MRFNLLAAAFMISFTFHGHAQDRKVVYKDPDFISAVLKQHNTYRSALQLPALTWSPALAQDALAWGKHLASIDKGEHDQSVRGKEGENLWWGTAGAFSYPDMVSMWGNEQKDFKYGIYPDVAKSRGAAVGHYTQLVWKTTTYVGCALVSNGNNDYLVCRYSPPGNEYGKAPY